MDKNPKPVRPVLSLANQTKTKKKDKDEKEKEMSKENIRRNQADNHYSQTLRKALAEVIGSIIYQFWFYIKNIPFSLPIIYLFFIFF